MKINCEVIRNTLSKDGMHVNSEHAEETLTKAEIKQYRKFGIIVIEKE